MQGYLEGFIKNLPDPAWVKDTNGVFLTCNPAVERFFNLAKTDIVGRTDFSFASDSAAKAFRLQDKLALESDSPLLIAEWRTSADGNKRLFETMKAPLRDAAGVVVGVMGVARDVTERFKADIAQESLTRALKLIGKCNHAMMHAACEQGLLDEICQLSVEIGGYSLAWVGFVDFDGERTILPTTWSPGGCSYIDRLHVSWADDELGRGPVGVAIREGRTVVNQDYRSNPATQPWKSLAEEHGFRSCITIPLMHEGQAFGVFNIYSDKPNSFSPDEIPLLEELTADLAFGIQTLRAKAEHMVAKQKLEFLEHHDTLTLTPNRMLLRKRFKEVVAHADTEGNVAAVLLLDLDNFKAINEGLGHDHGDKMLIEVARGLQERVADAGVMCRYGGDEFAVLLQDVASEERALELAKEILATFEEPIIIDGIPVEVTFSIGISFYPRNAKKLDRLIRFADIALQRAKNGGKNTLCAFDADMKFDDDQQIGLRAQLSSAIRNDELVLHYQPKVNLRTGAIVGAEALLRWQHPERGLLGPGAFVPLAERSGLIIPAGEWVLRQACRQVAMWLADGLPLESVSVNVSAFQLRRGNFVRTVADALAVAGLPAHYIELELTESAFLHDPEAAVKRLQELRQLGVKLSIDDFGTGYSNLAYLKMLRVDRVKMDRLFIKDLPECSDSMAIVKTMIQLGRNLQLAVTAEGVETQAQLQALRELGCDEVQGFLLSKPIDADSFERLCRESHASAVSY